MATIGSEAPKQTDILLESGTNELEVLAFRLGNQSYGVNVAKVREVILPTRVTASPNQPHSVKGMFNLRGRVLPLVDLHGFFGIDSAAGDPKDHRVIVTEFNGAQAAFEVDGVDQIHRMSWSKMKPVPETGADDRFAITGITELHGKLVMMLDFESVYDQVAFQDQYHCDYVENRGRVERGRYRIFVAEDSRFIQSVMKRLLNASGYVDLHVFENGLEAWNALRACLAAEPADGSTPRLPDVLISDIEMPQMDGLHLCRRVKEDPRLRGVPVAIFSSIVTEETRHKSQSVGAEAQIGKPELPRLVELVDHWVSGGVGASSDAGVADPG